MHFFQNSLISIYCHNIETFSSSGLTNSHDTTIQVQALNNNDNKNRSHCYGIVCTFRKLNNCYHTRYEVFEDDFLFFIIFHYYDWLVPMLMLLFYQR